MAAMASKRAKKGGEKEKEKKGHSSAKPREMDWSFAKSPGVTVQKLKTKIKRQTRNVEQGTPRE